MKYKEDYNKENLNKLRFNRNIYKFKVYQNFKLLFLNFLRRKTLIQMIFHKNQKNLSKININQTYFYHHKIFEY